MQRQRGWIPCCVSHLKLRRSIQPFADNSPDFVIYSEDEMASNADLGMILKLRTIIQTHHAVQPDLCFTQNDYVHVMEDVYDNASWKNETAKPDREEWTVSKSKQLLCMFRHVSEAALIFKHATSSIGLQQATSNKWVAALGLVNAEEDSDTLSLGQDDADQEQDEVAQEDLEEEDPEQQQPEQQQPEQQQREDTREHSPTKKQRRSIEDFGCQG